MTVQRAPVWEHRPAAGPVAWGSSVVAALLAPVPLVWTGTMLDIRDVPFAALTTSVAWALAGLAVALVPHRIARGAGIGLVAGVVTCALVLVSWSLGS